MGGLGAWAGLGLAGANLPILSAVTERGQQLADVGELTDRLEEYGRRFSDMKDTGEWGEEEGAGQGRKLRGLGVEPGQFRGDTLTDINSGLRVVATGIQIISTILTLLGAETTDRNDNFEEAVGSAMDMGALVLKVGLNKAVSAMLSSSSATPSSSLMNKVGVAAPTTPQLSPQDLIHKQQVTAYVSKLSPAQIKLQQSMVQEHVVQQAAEQGMNAAQAALLLAQTLEHNGLPQVASPVENTIASVASGAGGLISGLSSLLGGPATIDKVGLPAPTDDDTWVPGLPRPGTLEHTLTMALFKAQQGINSFMGQGDPVSSLVAQLTGGPSQPAIDQKVGLAADAVEEPSSGILATVASLPQSVGSAAVSLIKFVTPPQATGGAAPAGGPAGITYSEVTTGINPTYAALGVLTTGALGSVLYSYAAQSPGLASSATSLAQGAISALQRKDIVSVASNTLEAALDGATSMLGGALGGQGAALGGHVGGGHDYTQYGQEELTYGEPTPSYDYGLYDYSYSLDSNTPHFQTQFKEERVKEEDTKKEVKELPEDESFGGFYGAFGDYSNFGGFGDFARSKPKGIEVPEPRDYNEETEFERDEEETKPSTHKEDSPDLLNSIPNTVEFYEPSLTTPSPSVPYVSYQEEHNPWLYLQSGASTDHLYRSFS